MDPRRGLQRCERVTGGINDPGGGEGAALPAPGLSLHAKISGQDDPRQRNEVAAVTSGASSGASGRFAARPHPARWGIRVTRCLAGSPAGAGGRWPTSHRRTAALSLERACRRAGWF
jgi:hypothetical protein